MKRRLIRKFSSKAQAPQLNFLFGAHAKPHPDKLKTGGEDSFFTDFSSRYFGVADGVGGYINKGIDSGLYSRAILKQCQLQKDEPDDLHKILVKATRTVKNERLPGGCTATLGKLVENKLSILNFGDAGIVVFRPCIRLNMKRKQELYPRIVYRSIEQTHYFNCPYQLNSEESFKVIPADLLSISVHEGDYVICATDGLFDNLYNATIQLEVSKLWFQIRDAHQSTKKYEQILQQFAHSLCEMAQKVGKDPKAKTPFEENAKRENVSDPGGGKLDDVTVVVGLVGDFGFSSETSTMDNFELPDSKPKSS